MKKILHVISSPRGASSLSIKLGNEVIGRIKAAYPGSVVKERNPAETSFPHLEESHIASFHTPAESRTPALVEAVRHSDEVIAEVMEADIIVIGAPVYNFNIHSSLKAWIDHLVRSGATFKISEKGAEGLVTGKKVYVALSSGGVLSEGPMHSHDFVPPYLKAILGFIGLTDITVFRVEGVSIPGIQDTAWEKSVASIAL